MSVRERIDALISDSIDEVQGRASGPRPSVTPSPAVDLTTEIQSLAAQVRELTSQVEVLVTIIRRLREE